MKYTLPLLIGLTACGSARQQALNPMESYGRMLGACEVIESTLSEKWSWSAGEMDEYARLKGRLANCYENGFRGRDRDFHLAQRESVRGEQEWDLIPGDNRVNISFNGIDRYHIDLGPDGEPVALRILPAAEPLENYRFTGGGEELTSIPTEGPLLRQIGEQPKTVNGLLCTQYSRGGNSACTLSGEGWSNLGDIVNVTPK